MKTHIPFVIDLTKRAANGIRRELVLKLDFEKFEFEIGWIWVGIGFLKVSKILLHSNFI